MGPTVTSRALKELQHGFHGWPALQWVWGLETSPRGVSSPHSAVRRVTQNLCNWLLFCSVGEGNGTPLQHSCLENPMDRGAWKAAGVGSLRVGHDWATSLSVFTFMHWRRKWATHSSVLAWRLPGTGEPGGLPSMGSHRVGHDWSDLAAAFCSVS